MIAKAKVILAATTLALCAIGTLLSNVDMVVVGGSRATAAIFRCPLAFQVTALAITTLLGAVMVRNTIKKKQPGGSHRILTMFFVLSVFATLLGLRAIVVEGEGDEVVLKERAVLFTLREARMPITKTGVTIEKGPLFFGIENGVESFRIFRGIPPLSISDTLLDHAIFTQK